MYPNIKIAVKVFIFLLFLHLSGCMGPVVLPEIHRYQLTGHGSIFVGRHSCTKTLFVSMPQAISPYDTSKMFYRKKCNEIGSFSEHRWISTPAQMLLPPLIQAMCQTHRFKGVVAFPTVANADYRLDTTVVLLQQEFRCKKSYVHVMLDATLMGSCAQKILATRHIDVYVPTQCPTPVAGVSAYQCALSQVLLQLQYFVVEVL
jgi:cholesterol transport system auxiliary component